MADEERPKQQADDPFASLDISADHDTTDWGEDWEAAFKADDSSFFTTDEAETEGFFLEEESKPGTAAPAPNLDASLKQSLASIPDQQPAGVAKSPATALAIQERFKALLVELPARLQTLPQPQRYALFALPFVLLLLGVLLPLLLHRPPQISPTPSETQHLQPQPGPSENAPANLTPGQGQEATPAPTAGQPSPTPPPQEKVRRKWAFPGFLIPITAAAGQPATFVVVDLTIVAAMEKSEELPPDKQLLIRDAIFQFYQNRPLEELRRYSMARSEMGRRLREWIAKEWPAAPIESITFGRYHLS